MDKPIIEVQGLSKLYTLGSIGATSLRESAERIWAKVRRRQRVNGKHLTARFAPEQTGPLPNSFWALREIDFSVQPGEVVGLIGQNGAGKSTLLKILSRITEPTKGRAILRGRVASLLEVGTGFHPELTGRDNIYLNGAILGMKHAEITRKFDEIVAFAEVEDFIDTPVKRYSSGMTLRLAFAVAAHLEPEILLVDEVLAVGDATFQKKCLGKMGDVARHGRTVLVVSHNMASILALCQRGIILKYGTIHRAGPIQEVVHSYLESSKPEEMVALNERHDREGDGSIRFESIAIENAVGGTIRTGSRCKVTLGYKSMKPVRHARFLLTIYDMSHISMFQLDSEATGGLPDELPAEGSVVCETEPLSVTPGRCYMNLELIRGHQLADRVTYAAYFDVEEDDFFGTGKLPKREWTLTVMKHRWRAACDTAAISP
ncbi:MAG TPA: ABC transporter ATP-binding protein [Chthoniobacteraceae bacterium]|jgi:lipopolysaccharide transport system ATP-binding protein|nr:ABC transporter ATP-binding protein [Chthoniobacteraceae bacterium]